MVDTCALEINKLLLLLLFAIAHDEWFNTCSGANRFDQIVDCERSLYCPAICGVNREGTRN